MGSRLSIKCSKGFYISKVLFSFFASQCIRIKGKCLRETMLNVFDSSDICKKIISRFTKIPIV